MATEDTLERENAGRIWRDARQRIEEANAVMDTSDVLDFAGEHFPVDPSGAYFHGIPFRIPVSFADSTFECDNPLDGCEFWDETDWTGCRFAGTDNRFIVARCRFKASVDFRACVFATLVIFRGVSFEEDADFSRLTFGTIRFEADDTTADLPTRFTGVASFDECTFHELNCDGVEFLSDTSFKGATFAYWTTFHRTRFCGTADFSQSKFTKQAMKSSKRPSGTSAPRNRCSFVAAHFEYDALFNDAVFECDVNFSEAIFGRDAIFDGAHIHGRIGFRCAHRNGDIRFATARIHDRSQGGMAYRVAKNAAHARGDSRLEGTYHFMEQCATNAKERRTTLMLDYPWICRGAVRSWWNFIFGRYIFGYGERPERVLYCGLVVIILWAALYYWNATVVEGLPSYGTALYYSVVTFTTLGYGDLSPKEGLGRVLSGAEALLGAGLMALFVVTLTRKFMR